MRKLKFNYKIVAVSLVIIVIYGFKTMNEKKDCDDVISYAEDAYSYFKKAYNASSLIDAQWYIKKGINEASNAEDEAGESDCECVDAENAAGDVYSYGRKAYNSSKLSDLRYYAKKAMDSSSEIIDEADDCQNTK